MDWQSLATAIGSGVGVGAAIGASVMKAVGSSDKVKNHPNHSDIVTRGVFLEILQNRFEQERGYSTENTRTVVMQELTRHRELALGGMQHSADKLDAMSVSAMRAEEIVRRDLSRLHDKMNRMDETIDGLVIPLTLIRSGAEQAAKQAEMLSDSLKDLIGNASDDAHKQALQVVDSLDKILRQLITLRVA